MPGYTIAYAPTRNARIKEEYLEADHAEAAIQRFKNKEIDYAYIMDVYVAKL